MKIQSNKLQRIFKYLMPSTGSSFKLPEFNSFLFDATENMLTVRIYSGVIESIAALRGEFEPARFAVDEFIYKIINQLDGEINFELDGTTLIVDCGAKHYEFTTVDCENWQHVMDAEITEPFNAEWIQSFNKINHAIATDESRPIYTNYHIRDGLLFATDGYRLSSIPVSLVDYSFVQNELDLILRCLDGEIYYKFDDDYLYFRCVSDDFEVRYMTAKADNGEPLDVNKFFAEKESANVGATIVFDNLQKELSNVLLLQKQAKSLGSKFIFTINGEHFITHVTGFADSKQKVKCDIDGGEFEFGVNPSYLMDFAKAAGGKVTMKILEKDELGNDEPALLYDESGLKSMIMPVRIPT